MDLQLSSRKALVLGASQGLGRAIASSLIQEGVQTAICSRNKERLEKTQKEIDAHATIALDLNENDAGKRAVEEATRLLGGVDILVSNTGGPTPGKFEDLSGENWKSGFQGLWMSAVDSIQAALPSMKAKKWGRILLVTSVAGVEPMAKLTLSSGLRAGLHGLAKTLSHQIASHGITINVLAPGYTDTERLRELNIAEETIRTEIPAQRLGRPEELAALATFLASEQAAYINGQAIACDGGLLRG